MIVNGKSLNLQDKNSVLELLKHLNIDENTVVVEVDGQIIEKETYKNKKLLSSSEVEIIRFVGGG